MSSRLKSCETAGERTSVSPSRKTYPHSPRCGTVIRTVIACSARAGRLRKRRLVVRAQLLDARVVVDRLAAAHRECGDVVHAWSGAISARSRLDLGPISPTISARSRLAGCPAASGAKRRECRRRSAQLSACAAAAARGSTPPTWPSRGRGCSRSRERHTRRAARTGTPPAEPVGRGRARAGSENCPLLGCRARRPLACGGGLASASACRSRE